MLRKEEEESIKFHQEVVDASVKRESGLYVDFVTPHKDQIRLHETRSSLLLSLMKEFD